MILQDIIDIIESVAPLNCQETWDNSGLQVGERNAEVHAALLTIDITESVVGEAISKNCNVIISHHPLLFHGLKHLTGETEVERCILMALHHNIAIYSAHTSMDVYKYGVSGKMAQKIGLSSFQILKGDEYGLGVIGELPKPIRFVQLLENVQRIFHAPCLNYVEGRKEYIKTIALCGGAGAELMEDAIARKADVYISADFKYHEMQAAKGRISVIQMDHWVSEHFTTEVFAGLLKGHIPTYISQTDCSPVKVYMENNNN